MAFLNGASCLLKMTAWSIEVAPVPDSSNVATPTNPIITIPTSIYRMRMVMMPKKGVPGHYRIIGPAVTIPHLITSVGAAFSWCTKPPRPEKYNRG